MIKKLIIALSAVAATSATLMAAAPANAAVVCHRVFVHGHPQRICRPVPHHRPPPRDFHGPGPRY
jgi:hypothetical protein